MMTRKEVNDMKYVKYLIACGFAGLSAIAMIHLYQNYKQTKSYLEEIEEDCCGYC